MNKKLMWAIIFSLLLQTFTFKVMADANGKPIIIPVSCSGNIFSAADKLCSLFENIGGAELCNLTNDTCVEGEQQIFTGNQIELASPTNIKFWTGYGGLGISYLGANLCMLRDIKDGAITSQAQAITPLGKVEIKQKLGFYSFNKNTYQWEGYHSSEACVPVFGCIDIFDQKITASAVNVNMRGSGKKAGQYDVHSAHALNIKTDGLAQSLKVTIPAIQVKTPYGQIAAKPEFNFARAIGFILAPYDKGNIKSLVQGPWGRAKLTDLYGVNPGTAMTGTYPQFLTTGSTQIDKRVIGYLSQVGFGSRDANPSSGVWSAPNGVEYPLRDDLNLKKARSAAEKIPNAYISAGVEVSYSPTDLLPAAIRNNSFIDIGFKVFATPLLDAGLTSQFNIAQSEISQAKKLVAPAGPIDYRPMFMEQYKGLVMHAGSSAAGRFSLTAGVDLTLHLQVPLPWPMDDIDIKLIDIHPRTKILEVIDVGYGKGSRDALAFSQASKTVSTGKFFQSYKTFKGQNVDGAAHIQACLAAPNAQGELPDDPDYTPGNPEDLTKNILYPCNICVGMDTFSYKDENQSAQQINGFLKLLFPASQNTRPSQARWNCDKIIESGCHDMCSYDPSTNKLTVVETAKEMRAKGAVSSGPIRCN